MGSDIHARPRVMAATKLLPDLNIVPVVVLDVITADSDGALLEFYPKAKEAGDEEGQAGETHALGGIAHVQGFFHVAA